MEGQELKIGKDSIREKKTTFFVCVTRLNVKENHANFYHPRVLYSHNTAPIIKLSNQNMPQEGRNPANFDKQKNNHKKYLEK